MNGRNILEAMEHIGPELIEEADAYKPKRKLSGRRARIAAAVCLLLALAGAWGIWYRSVKQDPPSGATDPPAEDGTSIPASEPPDTSTGSPAPLRLPGPPRLPCLLCL